MTFHHPWVCPIYEAEVRSFGNLRPAFIQCRITWNVLAGELASPEENQSSPRHSYQCADPYKQRQAAGGWTLVLTNFGVLV